MQMKFYESFTPAFLFYFTFVDLFINLLLMLDGNFWIVKCGDIKVGKGFQDS